MRLDNKAFIFCTFLLFSSCSNETSKIVRQHSTPETRIIYQESNGYSIKQAKAFREISEIKCKSGSQHYCFQLSKMLANGIGGYKDVSKSTFLANRACKENYLPACEKDK